MSAHIYQDWRPKTLKELTIQWQAVMLETWHHTAHIKGSFASGKVKYSDLHPYIQIQQKAHAMAIKARSIFRKTLEEGSSDDDEDRDAQYQIPTGTL